MHDLRPFYFSVVFWGERFRDYLTDFCLPSLLSPNNIPSLRGGRHNRFIFCTTPDDWAVLTLSPIFSLLERYIHPYFAEISLPLPGRSGCEHMGVGHKLATEMAHKDEAYGVFITPDLMISDGSVAALERHARARRRVVLSAALRFGEEPLFENLRAMGILCEEERLSLLGRPLTITSRAMVGVALRSFHSETRRYEWEAPYFTSFPCACWWRVPSEDGIVVHSLSWAPLLLDYSIVGRHDTRVLESWTIDADYVYRNFGDGEGIHVVTDSDEIMLVSWAPLSDRPQSLAPSRIKSLPVIGEWAKGAFLRGAITSGIFDPLKQRIFFLPVRWHARELTPSWLMTERKARRTLRRYLPDLEPRRAQKPARKAALGWLFLRVLAVCARVGMVLEDAFAYPERRRAVLRQAMRGDCEAVKHVSRWFRVAWRRIRGMPIG